MKTVNGTCTTEILQAGSASPVKNRYCDAPPHFIGSNGALPEKSKKVVGAHVEVKHR